MSKEYPLILQLDLAGNPINWIDFETAAYYEAKDLIAWKVGTTEFTIYGGDNSITGRQSSMDLNTIVAVRGSMNPRGLMRVPSLVNETLFRRDQHMCAYCGLHFPSTHLTRDHIIPTSKGGKNVWANVVTACGPCNKFKDDRTPEQCGMKLKYTSYTPNRAEWLILRNRTILEDQMNYLLSRVTSDSRLKKGI
jgi:hypothetical protein